MNGCNILCLKNIKPTELKNCFKCNTSYHYQCIGVSTENFLKESKAHKAAWECSECKNPRTPSQSTYIDQQTERANANSLEELKLEYFNSKLEASLSQLLKDIRRDFTAESADTRGKIEELTKSVQFMSAKYDQLTEELGSKTKRIEILEAENNTLKQNLTDVNTRLNQNEQQSRESNLEIQCVPETEIRSR